MMIENRNDIKKEGFSSPAASPYARPAGEEKNGGEQEFAPPVRLNIPETGETASTADFSGSFRPVSGGREEGGYLVQEEVETGTPKKRGALLLIPLLLILLAAAVFFFRQPLHNALEEMVPGLHPAETASEEEAAALPTPTPVPVKAYEPGTMQTVSDTVLENIRQLTGKLNTEIWLSTADHVVMRCGNAAGGWDYYVFSAVDGRLLGYYEGTADSTALVNAGALYVPQEPYLLAADGSALIRTAGIAELAGGPVSLSPMYRGWAELRSERDGMRNYVNVAGELLSPLWMCRAWPFTGEYTAAWVDTGAVDDDQRYLLYAVSRDGSMIRWTAAADPDGLLVSANGLALTPGGELYSLPEIEVPAARVSAADFYPDCGACVARDAESGLYCLYVNGVEQYPAEYDSICPVESDLRMNTVTLEGTDTRAVLYAASPASAMPVTYYFRLEKDGGTAYVALSASEDSPFRLNGEF